MSTPTSHADTHALSKLVDRRERIYYAVMLVISLGVYAGIVMSVLAVNSVSRAEGNAGGAGAQLGVILVYVLVFMLIFFLAHGIAIGRLRGNGIRVGATQFPMLHQAVSEHARALGLKKIPAVFVMQAGGLLNAFATRFFGRDFVVLYSDVVAVAQQEGRAAVGFIVAHELAHVRRGHLKHRWLILPGRILPYLGAAYSRACEYTCDRFAAYCQPDGAVDGLLVLAAGPDLYKQVDARQYARQVESEGGFWVRRAELMSTHPNLTKRVKAVIAAGANVPTYAPTAGVSAPARSA